MVLHRHFRELFERGAVFARMLHAGFGEYRRHRAGTDQTFARDAAAAAAAEQTGTHFLDADREHGVVEAGFDGGPRFTECGGAGGARVRDVDDRNTGLADLLQDALPDHAARLAQVAAIERLHVLNLQTAVVQRAERCDGAEHVHVRAGAGFLELRHIDADDIYVTHLRASSSGPGLKEICEVGIAFPILAARVFDDDFDGHVELQFLRIGFDVDQIAFQRSRRLRGRRSRRCTVLRRRGTTGARSNRRTACPSYRACVRASWSRAPHFEQTARGPR